jgi:hypothetical protein
MKRLLIVAVLAMFAMPAAALADRATAVSAYERGDHARALAEFKPLAEEGDAVAQYYVGLLYAKGLGVHRDNGAAFRWFGCAYLRAADGELRVGAKRWRDHAGDQLSSEAREQIAARVKLECGPAAAKRTSDIALIYNPSRNGWFETIAYFTGDLTILGAITASNFLGFHALARGILTVVQFLGDWFIGLISLAWWLLGARVLMLLLDRESSDYDPQGAARFSQQIHELEDRVVRRGRHPEDGGN